MEVRSESGLILANLEKIPRPGISIWKTATFLTMAKNSSNMEVRIRPQAQNSIDFLEHFQYEM